MTFVLKSHHEQRSQNNDSSCAKLNKIFYQNSYELVWIKYFQNFYQQTSSYFVFILAQQGIDKKGKKMQIKRVYPNKENVKITKSDNTQKMKETSQTKIQAEISFITNEQQKLNQNTIIAANFIHQNALIVMNNPFQLYFLTKKSSTPIKILLQQPYQLTNVTASFSFETNDDQKRKQPFYLTVYGEDKNTQMNKLLTINLMTFEMKEIIQSKDYSPKARSNHFQMFHDDRLYVFGGQNKKKIQIQELLWSFDQQKGYWFALQMKYKDLCQKFDSCLYTVYDSGKIILFKDSHFYLLEIYQCKITKINHEEEDKFIHLLQSDKIKGMFVFQKKIYFYTEKSLISRNFTLQKEKKETKGNQKKSQ